MQSTSPSNGRVFQAPPPPTHFMSFEIKGVEGKSHHRLLCTSSLFCPTLSKLFSHQSTPTLLLDPPPTTPSQSNQQTSTTPFNPHQPPKKALGSSQSQPKLSVTVAPTQSQSLRATRLTRLIAQRNDLCHCHFYLDFGDDHLTSNTLFNPFD